jgi:excisionase family DNA binding protein
VSAPKLGDTRKNGGQCYRWPNARLVGVAQVAEELGRPYGEIAMLVRTRRIRALKFGRKYLIERKDLDRFIENCKKELEQERRVRDPGCKYDEMLVLESSQGWNKSSALKVLAVKDEWFTDDLGARLFRVERQRDQLREMFDWLDATGDGGLPNPAPPDSTRSRLLISQPCNRPVIELEGPTT